MNAPAIAMHADYQTRLGLSYAPSAYQSAIFEWIEGGRGHRAVRAVAGSGKTTTVVSAARLISGEGLFVAFNKSIADMLSAKLAGTPMRASTLHSHGFAAIRNRFRSARVDSSKYAREIDSLEQDALGGSLLGRSLTADERDMVEDEGYPRGAVAKLLDFARLDLLHEAADEFGALLQGLADHHDVDFAPELARVVAESVRHLLVWGKANTAVVDFTDMVWLPTALRLRPRAYSWIFVDEAQDLSRATLRLVSSSLRPGGRVVFVGDPKQAINGFAGADCDAWDRVLEFTGAPELPLSVCYRCPTSVVELARTLCPEIEARPGAPEGTVRASTRKAFIADAKEGDMVLCRRNAPLLGMCFALIAEGVSAAVKGRDIASGLVKIVEQVGRKCRRFEDFAGRLVEWGDAKKAAAAKRYKDADKAAEACEIIEDQVECIRVIQDRSGARGPKGLITAIEDLFSDGNASVTLSSIHKAKGLEAHRVALLEPEKLKSPRGRGWQLEQEFNLAYVAYTRAMSELIEIVEDAK